MRPAKLSKEHNIKALSTKIEPHTSISKANASSWEKVELTSAMGLRMIYCGDSKVVELEIGAVSFRLRSDVVQRMDNIMMKASLNSDLIADLPAKNQTVSEARMIHCWLCSVVH